MRVAILGLSRSGAAHLKMIVDPQRPVLSWIPDHRDRSHYTFTIFYEATIWWHVDDPEIRLHRKQNRHGRRSDKHMPEGGSKKGTEISSANQKERPLRSERWKQQNVAQDRCQSGTGSID